MNHQLAPRLPLLVVGCGNEMAGDDSAGLEIVKQLRARGGPRPEFVELAYSGLELLDLLDRADTILFVDAVSSGAPPGTLHLVELPCPGLEPRALGRFSLHSWGLPEVVLLARALNRPVPRLVLLGVEVASVAPGTACSGAVQTAITQAVDRYPDLEKQLVARRRDAHAA